MIKVVLTDDHKIVRDGIRALLEKEPDMEVIGEADNGRLAVKLAGELKPDIMIMDMTMHDLNGIEATDLIKKENPKMKVIALSMHIEKHIIARAFKAGVSGYVLKDASHTELIEAIRRVNLGRQYVTPNVSDVIVDIIYSGNKDRDPIADSPLSTREKEVLQLIAEGKNIKEIGATLFISPKTVASHRANIMDKLKVKNVAMLTKYAISTGITSAEINLL